MSVALLTAVNDAVAAIPTAGRNDFALETDEVSTGKTIVQAGLTAVFGFVAFFAELENAVGTDRGAVGIIAAVTARWAAAVALGITGHDGRIGTHQIAITTDELVEGAGFAVVTTCGATTLDVGEDGGIAFFAVF